jgi:V/A-type H+-transporting ATPase subunit I
MPWREAVEPTRMQRVAVVSPATRLRDVLVRVAEAGTVELDRPAGRERGPAGDATGPAATLLRQLPGASDVAPLLSVAEPDLAALGRAGRVDLVAGEADLESYAAAVVRRGPVVALAGWVPYAELPGLATRLAGAGGSVVPLAPPRGLDPPTLLRPGGELRSSMTPLVQTYATVPYRDIDPTVPAGLAYVLMFGMMFGDAGHGALLVLGGLMLWRGWLPRLARFRSVWPFVLGAGVTASFFGLLFGEFFGPTGVVPVLWLAPLEEPLTLLAWALGVGAVMLAGAYVVGAVNRWREGGWPLALVAASGIAGSALFAGLGVLLLGGLLHHSGLIGVGIVVALAGLVLAYAGFLANSSGGAAGVTQATVELFDTVLRLGTNLVSFARLAAFGLTHAALGLVVWEATVGLWNHGSFALLAAVAVFLLGNAVAFSLEALVAGVQALRLEYYELFSRVFTAEGRPFRPWHLPVDRAAPDRSTPSGADHVPGVRRNA